MAHPATPPRALHVTPDFDAGESVWLRLESKEVVDLTVVDWVEEGGKYLYQLEDRNGRLWQGGHRVQQKDLASSETRREPLTSYEKVAALLLSWHPDIDDLVTEDEVNELDEVFTNIFGYKTRRALLKSDAIKSAQIQANKHLSDFVYEHDDGNTLLIIYYIGHSRPGARRGILHLTGSTSIPNYESSAQHEIVWNSAEIMIQDTAADILVIFDCSFAGELDRSDITPKPNHVFEFLAATSANSTTKKPGPLSFTSALIFALKELVRKGSFSTQQLVRTIQYAPNFPEDQFPGLHERHPSTRKIILSALSQQSVKTARKFSQRKLSDLDTTLKTGSISPSSPSLNASQDEDSPAQDPARPPVPLFTQSHNQQGKMDLQDALDSFEDYAALETGLSGSGFSSPAPAYDMHSAASSTTSIGTVPPQDFSTSSAGNSLGESSTLPSSAPENHGNSQKRDVDISNSHLSQSTVLDTLGDEDDIKTLYSFVSESSAESDGSRYQAYFGRELFSYISSLSLNGNDMSRLAKDLPELLQIFTRKIGSESSAQVYRDIMRYVHKHRVPITKKFTALVAQNSTQEDDRPIKSRGGDLSYQDKVRDWQAKESDQDFPVEDNLFEGVDDDEEDDMSLALADFRRVVETSSAYHWLLQALEHDLLYSIPGDSHIAKIRTAILSRDAFRRVSRKSPPVTCITEYIVDWDPVNFIRSQEYDQAPKDVVIKALTLTGHPTEVEALTCGDYISRTWPQSGHQFLSLLQALLQSERGAQQQGRWISYAITRTQLYADYIVILHDGTSIAGFLRDADCIFQVGGKVDTVVEIGEQISWISCALRNSDLEGAVICTPVLRNVTETGRTLSSVSLTLELSADIAPIELGVDDQGCCWRRLFRSPLLVQGYPVARRATQTAGLEISLNTMMALIQTRRITPFKHRLFVKGHSTMLVATQEVSGLVLWHVITNEDGRYIYYHDERVDQCSPTLEDSAISMDFAEKRHVVGWWSQVKNFAGTSGAKLDIRGSALPPPGLGFAFDRVTVGGGKYLTVNVSAVFGNRDQPVQRTKGGTYNDQIRHARTIYVVFYDINDHRAWLVDGATALLHIARASLVADQKNGFRLLHQHHDIHEEEEVTENSAVRILTNPENMDMKIYEQPGEEESKTETKHVQGDSDPAKTEITVTYKTTHDRFSDRVSLVYSILDDIFNHQSDMSANGVGSKVSVSPLQQLEGFDFKDIAEGVKTLHPKTLSLGWKGMGWVDMLRDLHAITLFGRGFGDILEPQVSNPADSASSLLCPGWSRVPCNFNYLAVSNITLQGILENQGELDQTPRLVARQLYWHCPDKYCEGCTESHTEPCRSAQGCRCDRVQVILPKTIFTNRRFQSPEQIPIGGATIFGHSQKCPVRWKTSHSATETVGDGEPSTIAVNERSSATTAARDNLKRKFGAFLGRSKPTKNAS